MGYRIEGTYFENCNCDVACPCGASNLVVPATNERCNFLMAFRVGSGEVDGVDVSGATLALVGDTPGQMSDGGWRVGLIFDADTTTEEQRQALIGVFSGQMGGPPGLLAPMVGEMLGVEVVPIRYEEDGRRRQTYTATEAGLAALKSWLAEPTEEQLQVRDVAELKLFFAEFARPDDILALAREQIEQHRERISVYEAMRERFRDREDIADRMVPLRLGLAMEYAALEFWEKLEKERS